MSNPPPTLTKWQRYIADLCERYSSSYDLPPEEIRTLHNRWHSMRGRCYCRTTAGYEYYGARGIQVCFAWRKSFDAFLGDVVDLWRAFRAAKPDLSFRAIHLDRIDNDGHYGPHNIRFADTHTSAMNKRTSVEIKYSPGFVTPNGWKVEKISDYQRSGLHRPLVISCVHCRTEKITVANYLMEKSPCRCVFRAERLRKAAA